MVIEKTSKFVEPYPQPALGGKLGLHSSDVAMALGVEHFNILKKIRRNSKFFREQGYDFITTNTNGIVRPGPQNGYSIETELAKYIVCTWKNQIGVGYFRYLDNLDSVMVPNLITEIQNLKTKVIALTEAGTKRVKRSNGWFIKVPKVTMEISALFGDMLTKVSYESIPYKDAPEETRRLRRMKHRNAIITGLGSANERDCDHASNENTLTTGAKIIRLFKTRGDLND